jgi:hypothetical protein
VQRAVKLSVLYKLAVRILIEIKLIEQSRDLARLAYLSSALATLPLFPRHRLVCLRIAATANLEAHNYGIAAPFLKALFSLEVPDAVTIKHRLQLCEDRKLSNEVPEVGVLLPQALTTSAGCFLPSFCFQVGICFSWVVLVWKFLCAPLLNSRGLSRGPLALSTLAHSLALSPPLDPRNVDIFLRVRCGIFSRVFFLFRLSFFCVCVDLRAHRQEERRRLAAVHLLLGYLLSGWCQGGRRLFVLQLWSGGQCLTRGQVHRHRARSPSCRGVAR